MPAPIEPYTARRVLAGWAPQAIATAAGVSTRTAYRWRAEIVAIHELEVDGWVATFAIRRTRGPVRLDAWRRAA